MRRTLVPLLVVAAFVGASAVASAAPYMPTRASLASHERPDWWESGKFGIFVHWGVYSVPAYGRPTPPISDYVPAEWYFFPQQIPGTPAWQHHLATYGPGVVYDDFIPRWRAERYDPDAWMQLFSEAGARYVVLTAKHHDGFALWCSDTTGRDACEMGPRRDVVGDLVAAARRTRGRITPGLYYSIPEFFNPAPKPAGAHGGPFGFAFTTGLTPRNAYTQLPVPYTGQGPKDDYAEGVVRPQIRELIARYRPSQLWCDIGGTETYFRGNELIAEYYNAAEQANPEGVVVNDRCGDASTHHDYAVVEQGAGFEQQATGERSETARTMGESWGYDLAEEPTRRRSADALVDGLVTAVSSNSNYLLNVGPAPDGTIPEWQADRLRAIGAWLRINGDAVYGSRPWSTAGDDAVRFTRGRDGFVYATLLRWSGREVRLPGTVPTARAALLGSDERALPVRRDGDEVVVTLPGDDADAATRSRHAYVLRLGAPRRARMTVRTTRRRDGRTVTVVRLLRPAGVTAQAGCRGTVTLTARQAGRTVARRRLAVPSTCRLRVIDRLPRGAVLRARFAGNPVLRPVRAEASGRMR